MAHIILVSQTLLFRQDLFVDYCGQKLAVLTIVQTSARGSLHRHWYFTVFDGAGVSSRGTKEKIALACSTAGLLWKLFSTTQVYCHYFLSGLFFSVLYSFRLYKMEMNVQYG